MQQVTTTVLELVSNLEGDDGYTSDMISLTLVGYLLPNTFRKHWLNKKIYSSEESIKQKVLGNFEFTIYINFYLWPLQHPFWGEELQQNHTGNDKETVSVMAYQPVFRYLTRKGIFSRLFKPRVTVTNTGLDSVIHLYLSTFHFRGQHSIDVTSAL